MTMETMRQFRRNPFSAGSATGSGMRSPHFYNSVSFLPRADVKMSSKNQNIAGVTPATLNTKSHKEAPMETPQPDKTGMHILLNWPRWS
ncbi:hypothetical protein ACLK1T_14240 [Escherichia coli]